MASADESKIRQLILTEWQAKTNASVAVENIRKSFPASEISESKVNHWYKRFDAGDTSISELRGVVQNQDSTDGYSSNVANSILLTVNDPRFEPNMLTDDGRIGLFPSVDPQKSTNFTIMDLFNGTKR
jgi:hypothetical protein